MARPPLSLMPESRLVLMAQGGDRLAFGEIVRRRQGAVRTLCRRLCRDATEADDMAQDIFINAWRKLSTLQQPEAIGGWLRQIAVRHWLSMRRKPAFAFWLHREDIDDSVIAEDQGTEQDRLVSMDLQAALQQLRDDVRLCVILSYVEGQSHADIVHLTGWKLGTVKSHIGRGVAQLRRIL